MSELNNNIKVGLKRLEKNPKMYFDTFLRNQNKDYLYKNDYDKIYNDFYNFYGFNKLDYISLGDTKYFLENYILIKLLSLENNNLKTKIDNLEKKGNILGNEVNILLKDFNSIKKSNFIIPKDIFITSIIFVIILINLNIPNLLKNFTLVFLLIILIFKNVYEKYNILIPS